MSPAAPGSGTGAGQAGGNAAGAADQRAVNRRGPSRYRTAFFLLAVFGVVAAAAWALLGSRFLVVRSVEVTGTHLVPRSEVIAVAGIPDGLPLMRVNTGTVAHRIEHITQVQSATVTRDWPDRIVITVRERQAALAVPVRGGGFALVDPTGVIVRETTQRPTGLPSFIPSGQLAGNPGVRAAASVVRNLPASLRRGVTSVTVPELDAVTLRLSSGISVDWGRSGRAAQKARELAILMRTHARYYNVSAPGTATTSG